MQEMLAWKHLEETGRLPDEVYFPDAEDAVDPDSREVAELVIEQYAQTNADRRAKRLECHNRMLVELLEANGIEVPDFT